MTTHDYLYFYYENTKRIPIVSGNAKGFESIIYLTQAEKDTMQKNFPRAFPDNLYVFVDGEELKLL